MAKADNIYEQVLSAAGSIVAIDVAFPYDRYVFTGTGALVGAISISSTGTPIKGTVIKMQFDCTFTAGGATFTVFSTTVNSSLIGKSFQAEAFYNGATWDVSLFPDFFNTQIITSTNIIDATITGSKIAAATVALSNLVADSNIQTETLEISFETGEQCNNKIQIPTAFTITRIYLEVIKALAATNAGTIVPAIDGVNITLNTPITLAASTAINTTSTYNCTALNTGAADSILSFVAAKTDAGGKVRITIKFLQK